MREELKVIWGGGGICPAPNAIVTFQTVNGPQ